MLTAYQIEKARVGGIRLATALDEIEQATAELRRAGFDVLYPATRVAVLATIDGLRAALRADREERLAQHAQKVAA